MFSPDADRRGLRRRLVAIVLLLAGGIALLLARRIPTGIGFLMLFLAAACCGFAVLIAAGLPFASPGLRRAGKVVRAVGIAAVAVFLITLLSAECSILRYRGGAPREGGDYLIVLGAGLNGETPSLVLRTRIDAAAEYLEANPGTVAVLSGGRGAGETITEAEAMRRALTARGIAPERLILEDRSSSTRENVANSLALIGEMEQSRDREPYTVGVVSNDFHLYRALRLLREYGEEDAFSLSAPLPRLPLFRLNYYLREYFAVMKLYLGA